tara:strand:+ start:1067 stop:1291 length:225 start_codon:yes stop_codon:yes gene_type:complete
MRLLSDKQLEQLLEVSRSGKPVTGSVIFKLAYDIKSLRALLVRLVKAKERSGLFSGIRSQRDIDKVIEEIKEIL